MIANTLSAMLSALGSMLTLASCNYIALEIRSSVHLIPVYNIACLVSASIFIQVQWMLSLRSETVCHWISCRTSRYTRFADKWNIEECARARATTFDATSFQQRYEWAERTQTRSFGAYDSFAIQYNNCNLNFSFFGFHATIKISD